MKEAQIIDKVKELEAVLSLANNTLTVLKEGLANGGASKSPARKGKKKPVFSEQEIAKIKMKRQKARMKKATR